MRDDKSVPEEKRNEKYNRVLNVTHEMCVDGPAANPVRGNEVAWWPSERKVGCMPCDVKNREPIEQ